MRPTTNLHSTEGGDKVQGSADRRFIAGLPLPVPQVSSSAQGPSLRCFFFKGGKFFFTYSFGAFFAYSEAEGRGCLQEGRLGVPGLLPDIFRTAIFPRK